jgi:hypothetical protein
VFFVYHPRSKPGVEIAEEFPFSNEGFSVWRSRADEISVADQDLKLDRVCSVEQMRHQKLAEETPIVAERLFQQQRGRNAV